MHVIFPQMQRLKVLGQLLVCGGVFATTLIDTAAFGQSIADLDSDGVADIIDIDQDNDGIVNSLEGVVRLTDLSDNPADFFAAHPVDSSLLASTFEYDLVRLDNGRDATLVGTVLSSDTEVEWSMFDALPRLRNLGFGSSAVRWDLQGEGSDGNVDFTISDLDGLRSETVSVIESSIVGYSLSLNSNVVVHRNNGQLSFTGTGAGGDSIDEQVTLHYRNAAAMVIIYSNGLRDNDSLAGELGIAGYRHSLEFQSSTFFTPVTQYRDSDADGVADHRDLDSDNDGLGDVVESGGTDTDHDNLSDGAVNENGLTVSVVPGLSVESISRAYIADVTVSGDDADGDGLLSSVDGNLQEFGGALSNSDRDSDGLNDLDEVRIYTTSPDKADTDDDGLDDGDEVTLYNTDPLAIDTDGDGLTDGDEINQYGTSATNDDSDADGISDGEEIQNATDPLVSDRIIVVLQDPVPVTPGRSEATSEQTIPAASDAIEDMAEDPVVAEVIDDSGAEPELLLADDAAQANEESLRTGIAGVAGCSVVSASGTADLLLPIIIVLAIGGLSSSTRRRKCLV